MNIDKPNTSHLGVLPGQPPAVALRVLGPGTCITEYKKFVFQFRKGLGGISVRN